MARKGRRSTNDERMNAIRMLQQGYTRVEVANILDVAESSVYEWQGKFRAGGLAALSTKIASGRKRGLTDEQLLKLYRWLWESPSGAVRFRPVDKEDSPGPDHAGIRHRLFAAERRQDPEDAGLLPQRPLWRALERDPERRREWTEEAFPAIKERADGEGRQASTSRMRRTPVLTTTPVLPGAVGQTPVVEHIGEREGIGMISAISVRGDMHWMVYSEPMNSALFTDYLALPD